MFVPFLCTNSPTSCNPRGHGGMLFIKSLRNEGSSRILDELVVAISLQSVGDSGGKCQWSWFFSSLGIMGL